MSLYEDRFLDGQSVNDGVSSTLLVLYICCTGLMVLDKPVRIGTARLCKCDQSYITSRSEFFPSRPLIRTSNIQCPVRALLRHSRDPAD